MLCDKCKKNQATFHKTVVINGDSYETHLCSQCVDMTDWGDWDGFDDDFLPNFFEPAFHLNVLDYQEKKCPTCHSTFRDFLRRGKLGCKDCYDTFEMEIRDMLENMESPIDFDLGIEESKPSKLTSLQAQLQKAIEEERYEDAGEIKKQIDKLKEGNKNVQ